MTPRLSLVTSEPTLGQIIDAHTAPVGHPRPASVCWTCLSPAAECFCDLDTMEQLSIWRAQQERHLSLLAEIPWRF